MSAEAFVQALHHSQATGTAKVIMLAIANYAGENGAWCAVSTLATIANVAPGNARKHLRALEELGEITTELNGGFQLNKPKHTRTNRYDIAIQCPEWCDRTMNHRDTRKFNPPTKSRAIDSVGANDSVGGSPTESMGEPKDNQLPKQELNTLTDLNANEREIDSNQSGEDYSGWSPADQLAKARRRMVEARDPKPKTSHTRPGFTVPPAPHVPRFDSRSLPPAPEHVSPEQQAANEAAAQLRCPAQGGKYRHLIPPATGTHCARCNAAAHDIINSQEAHA